MGSTVIKFSFSIDTDFRDLNVFYSIKVKDTLIHYVPEGNIQLLFV